MRSRQLDIVIANLAAEHRRRIRDPERIDHLRREIRTLKLEEYVRKIVDDWPPLTQEQIDRVAALLASAGPGVAA